ncbi:hypothetical protein VSS37_06545 [Candidatus Thiothrix sp. Deng01]|uniref:Uncharacterized protein n=1 Tax=Candidatus Thiothrix phosphatis TaxID=3112415 RepID=A0ABU6CUZ6_9GAMM|nr:hypothetical protein [Candidatus Thiothrix sp. Deng01]MEB4590630.1 hypothetical protein [Candidatus Thiothrix sp. Deng01]
MREYLYPAQPFNNWFQTKVIDAWQSSEKPFFAFAFCLTIPHKLTDHENQ